MKRLVLILSLCAAPLRAQEAIDDSDLASRSFSAAEAGRLLRESRKDDKSLVFGMSLAASTTKKTAPRTLTGTLLLADRAGAPRPAKLARARLLGAGAPSAWAALDEQGRFAFRLTQDPAGSYRVRFSLDNKYWAFRNPGARAAYEWESPAVNWPGPEGLDLGGLSPERESENGKLGTLHLTYVEATEYLAREGDVDWWSKTLTVNWPGKADFFSPWAWSLDLTNALAWDIVLHELGHAVMAGAMVAVPAGGEHFIDRCYTPALALSEGWASFFAAAVKISAGDEDARFEFMVPRRAPIRVENVPADVCSGPTSEWRVAAGFWDLYDTHPDGLDGYASGFARIWKAVRGKKMDAMASVWGNFKKDLNPIAAKAAEDALIQNTLLPVRPQPALVKLPGAEPHWDGAAR